MDPVNFTRSAAGRIARTVREVEGGSRDSDGPDIDRPWDSVHRRVFRVCTFTGSWSKNTAKVVTFINVTTTPNTVSATNLFVDLASCATTGTATTTSCAIAREGRTWYVIAAECC
jgi:hypothetical protein